MIARHAAVLYMAGAALCFTLMGVVIKHVSAEVSIAVIVMFRMVVALAIMIPWLLRNGLRVAATRRPFGHLTRAMAGGASLLCYIYALAHLSLADAIALSFTSPLWAIPAAAALLRERVGLGRWLATSCGFAGVLMLTRPHLSLDPAMLVALLGALLTALSQSTTRGLTDTEPPDRIVFYYSLFGTVAALGPAAYVWSTPSGPTLLWLILVGLLAAAGLASAARAFARADVTLLSPIDFLRLPLGAAIGFALFNEQPDAFTVLGSAIIAASTLYIVRRPPEVSRPRRTGDPAAR